MELIPTVHTVPRRSSTVSEHRMIWFYQCFIKDQGMEDEFRRFLQHVQTDSAEPEEEPLC
jgi:hypothetical protein